MLTIVLAAISTVMVLAALAHSILPIIPGGVLLAWLGLFVFAVGTHFERISVLTTVVFFVVTLLTMGFGFFVPMLVAGRFKAGPWGKRGALLGSIVGVILWGLWGVILGPFAGATLGELLSRRGAAQALRAGLGAAIGVVVAEVVNILVVLVMLGFLVASWF